VAAGLAAFAIGTETWGSIVCPSSFCGVSGLRPTYGRVSRYGAMALSFSMDKIGPMARSAEDCARVFSAIAGHDIRDRGTVPVDKGAFTYSPSLDLKSRQLRIGWLTNAWKSLDSEVEKIARITRSAVRKFLPGTRDTTLPTGPWEEAASLIVAVECAASFRDLIRSGRVSELHDSLGQIAGYVNQELPASDYLQALKIRQILQKKVDTIFESYDVLAAPTLPVTASALGASLEDIFPGGDALGAIGNMCGLPALSVPCGFTSKNLPVGLVFVAKAGDDLAVIQAARTYQQHTEFHRRRPKL